MKVDGPILLWYLQRERFLLIDDLVKSLHFGLVSYQCWSHHQVFRRHDSILASVLLIQNISNSIFSFPILRFAYPTCLWVKTVFLLALSLFLVPENDFNHQGSMDGKLLTGRGTFRDSIARKSRSRKNWSITPLLFFDWFTYLISNAFVCNLSKNSFTFGKVCRTPIRQLPFFSINFKW